MPEHNSETHLSSSILNIPVPENITGMITHEWGDVTRSLIKRQKLVDDVRISPESRYALINLLSISFPVQLIDMFHKELIALHDTGNEALLAQELKALEKIFLLMLKIA